MAGNRLLGHWREIREKHLNPYRRYWPAAFFLVGFLYDAWTLDRIDSLFGILKHGGYLLVIALLLAFEIFELAGHFVPAERSDRLARWWRNHELLLQFLLGSLLSEYTLFFFKSASLWSSVSFLFLMATVLLFNEFKHIGGRSGIPVRAALFSICLVCYFVYLVPVIQGYVGVLPFILSLACASLVIFIFNRILRATLGGTPLILRKQLLLPFFVVLGAISGLYFMRLIPPIPVAVRYIGVFHDIQKENGKYLLGMTRSPWKFWQNGDQSFIAHPGDKIFCFVRIFSPGNFSDHIQIRWLFDDPKLGWQGADAIPISITGGRNEGYRGFTVKSNYQPGDWQIRAESADGRELGRIYFTVEAAPSSETLETRKLTYEVQ